MVPHDAPEPLPFQIYFHGGGWTSGDTAPLTKYCASQAADGMIATHFQLKHMLEDANDVLDWVAGNIEHFGGDPTRIVLGGDSTGGHIAALLAASAYEPRLAAYMASARRSNRRTCAASHSTAASLMSRWCSSAASC